MDKSLETNLSQNNVGFCVKDRNKKVLLQNKLCIDICGKRDDAVCDIGCMNLYSNDNSQQWKENGSHVYKNTYVHNQYFDITVLASEDTLITFLQPLHSNYNEAIKFYREIGLSSKEFEVITNVIQNRTNVEICQLLDISKSTLKSHLNSIYRKVRKKGLEPKFIPGNRR